MTFYDENGPWMKAMRRRMRKWMAPVVLLVVLDVISFIFVFSFTDDLRELGVDDTVPVAFYALFALVNVPAVIMFAVFRRQYRTMKGVQRTQGRLCPICLQDMKAEQGALVCPRCKRSATPQAIDEYWTKYALDWFAIGGWMEKFKSRDAVDAHGLLAWYGKQMGEGWLAPLLTMYIGSTVFLLVISRLLSRSLLAGALEGLPVLLVVTGVILMFTGKHRRGSTRHCAKCDYQCPCDGQRSELCPECGADWRARKAIVKGERASTPGRNVIAVVVLLLGAALLAAPLANMDWKFPVRSTNMLISEVVGDRNDLTEDLWSELLSRSLSAAQQRKLTEALLDKRLADGMLYPDPGNWFKTQMSAGSLSAELVDRYYQETIEFSIEGPTQCRSGDAVHVTLRSLLRPTAVAGGDELFIILRGFLRDGEVVSGSRDTGTINAIDMRDVNPTLHLTAPKGGEICVEFDLWIVFAPARSLNGPISWQADGSLVMPPSVVWSQRITPKHIITIKD